MRKYHIVFAVMALFFAQQTFANMDSDEMKPCKSVAKACLKAGYAKRNEGKAFWKDCMKPVLMGKTVSGVKVSSDDATACRQAKITKMKTELDQLEQVK